jgi:multiple sugar transport system substrate-binding protein
MSKHFVSVFSIFVLFAACIPVDLFPQATESPGADVFNSQTPTHIPKATEVPSPVPARTSTYSPGPTVAPQPLASSTPTATDSPLLTIDPRGQKLTFWHVWGKSSAGEVLTEIIDQFNASNEWGIEVIALRKDSYGDLEFDFYRALESSGEPNVIVAYSNVLASLWNEELLADVNRYYYDAEYGFPADAQGEFYPHVLEASTYDGARVGFPFSQSGNVIFYNRTWAKELGFQHPPRNSDEFKDQACAASYANNHDSDPLNDGTGGYVLYPGTANILSWILAFEGKIFHPETQQYDFNSQPIQEVSLFLKQLNHGGCAYQTRSYPNREFATRKALFTTSSSVGCQYQQKEIEKQGSRQDEWQLLAFPGMDGSQAIVIFPQMLGLVDKSPEQNLATWLFMKYLVSLEVQAKWAEGSQYYPVRFTAIAELSHFATLHPQWASGFDLISVGRAEPTHPSWELVRQYTQTSFTNYLANKTEDGIGFLADLDLAAAEAVAEAYR